MTSKTPRTGNQYSIHYGDYSAVICELGAKIRRFDYQGKEIFCPFGVNDLTPTCNGYVLAPWPNRIENGEYDFNGKHYCAPVNEYHPAPRNNANHGYAYHYMWKLESLTDSAVTLSLRFPNLDGYPFDVTVTVTVTADGYLYNMVRILAGTLCEAGAGRLDPAEIPAILESRDRSRAGPTLPAKGLFLKCVEYDL